VIDMRQLNTMVSAGARSLIFAKQKLSIDDDLVIKGANAAITALLNQDEFSESVT